MKIQNLHNSLLTIFIIMFMINNGFSQTYPIVDTDVEDFYNNGAIIAAPSTGQAFYGQDANYIGNQPSYTNNGDGTITDNVTGLMWEQDMGTKISYANAFVKANTSTLGGYDDWRVPTIKELYSLILFTGRVFGENAIDLFIDTNYFNQALGNTTIGEREIDAQTWSATQYVGLTMVADTTVFGVNFIDGRIKGYPKYQPPLGIIPKTAYFRMVRGNVVSYGLNNFADNGDGTVTDSATGLMWQQADDGTARNWEDALSYAENLDLSGNTDWRLPNAKELQSIVDYSRSPQTASSPAIDPIFLTTEINDQNGNPGQYPYFWTGTTHLDGINPYSGAVYIAFGEARGWMQMPPNSGNYFLMDVHGAGAQRSDPKSGDPENYPYGNGPQGDVVRIYNYVRCVRGGNEIKLELKVFLEGAFNGTDMNTDLIGNLPLIQPFNTTPWNYSGIESVISIPDPEVVDWLLIELRDTTEAASATSATIIAQQAAFVKKDGNVVNSVGETELRFNVNFNQNLYLVVWHRNHLGVMSSNPLTESEGIYTYDFSSGENQAYGGSVGYKEITDGIWGMVSGNGNSDSDINTLDKINVWMIQAGLEAYLESDYNMDGNVNNQDKDDCWLPNDGFEGQVPD